MGIEKKLVYGKDGKVFEKKIHILENEKKNSHFIQSNSVENIKSHIG
jgi:hypothetical protein